MSHCFIVECDNDGSDEQLSKKSTPTSFTDDSNASVTINQVVAARVTAPASTPPLPNTDSDSPLDVGDNDAETEAESDVDNEIPQERERVEIPYKTEKPAACSTTTTTHNHAAKSKGEELPAKSCLSRHNSTHTSVKKKVNISTRAEIIEPDPLPPPPYALLLLDDIDVDIDDHVGVGNGVALPDNDDDEVFSDSLPPPKRESMCAPYIERGGGGATGTGCGVGANGIMPEAAFSHGLPEWFNNERINDM